MFGNVATNLRRACIGCRQVSPLVNASGWLLSFGEPPLGYLEKNASETSLAEADEIARMLSSFRSKVEQCK